MRVLDYIVTVYLVYILYCVCCNCFGMCGCVYVCVWNVCVCVGFVMCGCFGNMCTCVYCVLYFLYCVFVLFRLCIFMPPSDNSIAINNNNKLLPENSVKENVLWWQKPNSRVSVMYKPFYVKKKSPCMTYWRSIFGVHREKGLWHLLNWDKCSKLSPFISGTTEFSRRVKDANHGVYLDDCARPFNFFP